MSNICGCSISLDYMSNICGCSISLDYMNNIYGCSIRLDYMSNICGCSIRGSNCLPFVSPWGQPWFMMGSVLLIFLFFCVVLCLCDLFVFVRCTRCSQCLWVVFLDCLFDFSNVYLYTCKCPSIIYLQTQMVYILSSWNKTIF